MPITQLQLPFNSINVSAQIGDIVYYSYAGTSNGGFENTALSNTTALGPIVSIDDGSITVEFNDTLIPPPPLGSFISFAKDKKVNTTHLVGYYMQVDFENNSRDKAEIFSVGAEVTESSK